MVCCRPRGRLSIEVKDADKIGSDDPIGQCKADLSSLFGAGNWCRHLLANKPARVTLGLGDPKEKDPSVTEPTDRKR
eukprot:SAG22_NODE_7496_length_734_cov_1.622047_2_plen_77_part_00